ncbi:MAG TPA: 3-isopropylmalate dehydratase small subunit [Chromatiaceae bacterium]|jgi:3-isopropylmalate/(R)-2-methylmalate dehydratase small subunit|nr:3-isopropylmalate dehydratase small subunit [Chromatiaceae bacterium]HIO13720.1 3-isopropylmalate dehydratase small subunit [Chromatiales bacterium]
MDAFIRLDGLVAPLDRSNVDTDAIIPKQFLKSIKRTGFGPYLFDEWRYLDHGEPDMDCSGRPLNQDFVLNEARYQGAEILLARDNFGCGSSREHAPWALLDYGFRCVIGPGFADIFYNNCFKNGILPVVLSNEIMDQLFAETLAQSDYRLKIDLQTQTVMTPAGNTFEFEVNPSRRQALLNGLDEIGETLAHADDIRAYEARRKGEAPWLFTE